MTISYDPSDFNELTVLMKWRGTIMPAVLCRPAMWMLMAAHVTFYYLHMYRADVEMPTLSWKLTGVPTALLTFFLVFYSGNCFSRYYAFYTRCMGMSGAAMAYTGLLRVHLPKASPEKLWNLARMVVASVYLLYFQLSGGASDGGKRVTESEWKVLVATGLISEEEKIKLDNFRGFRPFLLQIWALRALQDHLQEDKEKGPGAALGPFQAQILTLRGHCAEIVDQSEPLPPVRPSALRPPTSTPAGVPTHHAPRSHAPPPAHPPDFRSPTPRIVAVYTGVVAHPSLCRAVHRGGRGSGLGHRGGVAWEGVMVGELKGRPASYRRVGRNRAYLATPPALCSQ